MSASKEELCKRVLKKIREHGGNGELRQMRKFSVAELRKQLANFRAQEAAYHGDIDGDFGYW